MLTINKFPIPRIVKVFAIKMLKRIFGPETEEITGEWIHEKKEQISKNSWWKTS
jgi:predicted small secreted protein